MLKLDPSRFYCCGHRGNEAYDPENSIAAFQRAIEFGVDFVETDIQMTKDKELVIFHDKTLNGKTNLSKSVKDYTLKELLDGEYTYFKDRREPLCSFEDVLQLFQNKMGDNVDKDLKKPFLIVEFKREFDQRALQRAINLIFEYKMENQVIIDSFEMTTLQSLRKLVDGIFISVLMDPISSLEIRKKGKKLLDSIAQDIKNNEFQAISLHKDNLTESIVNIFKENGLFVFGWGVKNPKEYEGYLKLKGLNGFTASHPDLLLHARKEILDY